MKECLERGDSIDESDGEGCTALHLSIQKRNYELFEFLLTQRACVGLSNGKGETPLHQAAKLDTEGRFLQRLLAAGANVNAETSSEASLVKSSPLEAAIAAKNSKAIELLVKAGAQT